MTEENNITIKCGKELQLNVELNGKKIVMKEFDRSVINGEKI